MPKADSRLVEIARIENVHGLEGAVRVRVSKEAEPLIETGSLLYLENRRGDRVPARVTQVRIEVKRKKRSFFVKFDRIADRSQAESYQDTPVYSDSGQPDLKEQGSIVGFEVKDETGLAGVVTRVLQSPAQRIIEVDPSEAGGTGTFLIPWVDEYVVSLEEENAMLICRNLDPLKDL